jgi:hypothetical protein
MSLPVVAPSFVEGLVKQGEVGSISGFKKFMVP